MLTFTNCNITITIMPKHRIVSLCALWSFTKKIYGKMRVVNITFKIRWKIWGVINNNWSRYREEEFKVELTGNVSKFLVWNIKKTFSQNYDATCEFTRVSFLDLPWTYCHLLSLVYYCAITLYIQWNTKTI